MSALGLLALLAAGGVPVLHVDVASSPGGDGSSERPFTRVADAVAVAPEGATVLIETGLYEEALRLARAIQLAGVGSNVVLAAPPGASAAVEISGVVTLKDLALQGGRAGVHVLAGSATLTRVGFRGQPDAALDCGSAACRVDASRFEASFASVIGIRSAGALEVRGSTFEGPFKRALDLQAGARVRGDDVSTHGASTGVFEAGADVELANLRVQDARVIGVFASGGRVHLTEAVLDHCGYGVLARDEAKVAIDGAVVEVFEDAAIATTRADVELSDWVSVGPTRDATLTFDGGTVRINGALLRMPGSAGIRARLSHGTVSHLTVLEAQLEGEAFGNAIFLADAELQIDDLDAEHLAGPAIEAQLGHSVVRGLTVVGGPASVAWEFQAHLDVEGLLQHGGTATGVGCIEGGQGRLVAPRFEDFPGNPWLIDCSCHLTVQPAPADLPRCGSSAGPPRGSRQTIPPRRP